MIDIRREKPLSVSEAAEHLKVTPQTIYRWFLRGLESAKYGGKRVTTLEALQRFGQSDFQSIPDYDPLEERRKENTRVALAALAEM